MHRQSRYSQKRPAFRQKQRIGLDDDSLHRGLGSLGDDGERTTQCAERPGVRAGTFGEHEHLRAFGQPVDLCGALLFLASSASDWMTGQTLSLDGGANLRI